MIIPVGVTTTKKTIAITIGEIIFPNKIPNLNQSIFKGVRILEFIIPKIKKIKEIIKDHNLKSCPFNIGYNAIIKKTIKKTIPKLLFDPILISLFFNQLNMIFLRFHILFFYTCHFYRFFHCISSKRFSKFLI